jgi:hypothetical protein
VSYLAALLCFGTGFVSRRLHRCAVKDVGHAPAAAVLFSQISSTCGINFAQRLTSGSKGFFYCAGHAAQLVRESFLVSTSVRFRTQEDFQLELMSIGVALSQLK